MNRIKLFLGAVILILGNLIYYYLRYIAIKYFYFGVESYIVLVLTYTLIALLPSLPPVTKNKKLCYFFDILLLLIILLPFIFPTSQITLFILANYMHIFFSLLLGYFIRLTFSLHKES